MGKPTLLREIEPLLKALEEKAGDGVATFDQLLRALTRFFEGKLRSEGDPHEMAAETIGRLTNKIAEGEKIDDVWRFAYGIAKFVWLEHIANHSKLEVMSDADLERLRRTQFNPEKDYQKKLCIEQCLRLLDFNERSLFLEYFSQGSQAKDVRNVIAAKHGVSLETLRVAIFRSKKKVLPCLEECQKI